MPETKLISIPGYYRGAEDLCAYLLEWGYCVKLTRTYKDDSPDKTIIEYRDGELGIERVDAWRGKMSDRNYPTRMHEILGVEPGERFNIDGFDSYYFLTAEGELMRENGRIGETVTAWVVGVAINHGIIRKPRLTAEQVTKLEALKDFGFKFMAIDADYRLFVYAKKPVKGDGQWDGINFHVVALDNPKVKATLAPLVSWADTEPLDILKTLRENGVEVEG